MKRDPEVMAAVKSALARLSAVAPGHAVELRVPPYAAIQCLPGPRHRRGTPPAVIEMSAQTWLALAEGTRTWVDALAAGEVSVSGERADLSPYLPLGHPAGDSAGDPR